MAKIFISYRRDDTQGEASHLAADLRRRYGEPAVFMDLATIGPGDEFAQAIERALQDCAVVLVLIGRRWLDLRDAQDRRRLDDPADWVRQELQLALGQRMRIVPVLVQGAALPSTEALPEPLRPLLRHNAHELTAKRWDYDFGQLAAVIDREVTPGTAARPRSPQALWLGGGAVAAVVAGGLAWWAMAPANVGAPLPAAAAPAASARSFFGASPQAGRPSTVDASPGALDNEKVASFLALTNDLAKRHDLSDEDLNRVAAAEDEACPETLLESPCKRTVSAAVGAMMSDVCKRRAGPAPAQGDQAASDMHELTRASCEHRYAAIRLKRLGSVVRHIKPG